MLLCIALLFPSGPSLASAQEVQASRTRAERTGFDETSRYADVIDFLAAVDSLSPEIEVTTFGYSFEGRELPVAIWAPGVSESDPYDPAALRGTEKTRVLVFANIHAGEVEGKEAAQILLRELAAGSHAEWSDSLILLVAPIYNADGNERVTLTNRPLQLGPIGGTGQRANAQGLDLNRDFTKLESPEARSLVGLLRDIDPHVVIDLHTTNGTLHGYHLTYSPPLHPNTDGTIDGFLRDSLLPSVTAALADSAGGAPACEPEGEAETEPEGDPEVPAGGCERLAELRRIGTWSTYYYGNLPEDEGFQAERGWYTFDARPRFSNNYVGLRNRFGILSEAYSYLPFVERTAVTMRFVEEILEYVYGRASAVRRYTEFAGAQNLVGQELTLRSEIVRSAENAEVLMGQVERVRHPYTGEVMLRRLDVQRPERMPEYGAFAPYLTERVPRAYLVPPDLSPAVDLLIAHGIEHFALAAPATLSVESFRIRMSITGEEEFEGHLERSLEGAWEETDERTLPAGTLVVPMDQPLARLAFLLLEPRSDDGLVNWNLLDEQLETAETYPILRTFAELPPRVTDGG